MPEWKSSVAFSGTQVVNSDSTSAVQDVRFAKPGHKMFFSAQWSSLTSLLEIEHLQIVFPDILNFKGKYRHTVSVHGAVKT